MDIEEAKELIGYSISTGLKVATSFIYGHYCDNESTMNDTYELMAYLKNKYHDKVEIYFSFNTPLPGTYQYNNREELGLRMIVSKFSELDLLHPVVVTKDFDEDMLYEFRNKSKLLMDY